MLDTKIETTKITVGVIASFALKYLGTNYKMIVLLMAFMFVDTVLGWIGAKKKEEWTSKNARYGIYSKLIELILIALMYMCEWAFDIDCIVNIVTTYFIICEGASIIENIVNYNLDENIPSELVDILSKIKKNVVSVILEKIKKLIGAD